MDTWRGGPCFRRRDLVDPVESTPTTSAAGSFVAADTRWRVRVHRRHATPRKLHFDERVRSDATGDGRSVRRRQAAAEADLSPPLPNPSGGRCSDGEPDVADRPWTSSRPTCRCCCFYRRGGSTRICRCSCRRQPRLKPAPEMGDPLHGSHPSASAPRGGRPATRTPPSTLPTTWRARRTTWRWWCCCFPCRRRRPCYCTTPRRISVSYAVRRGSRAPSPLNAGWDCMLDFYTD